MLTTRCCVEPSRSSGEWFRLDVKSLSAHARSFDQRGRFDRGSLIAGKAILAGPTVSFTGSQKLSYAEPDLGSSCTGHGTVHGQCCVPKVPSSR